MLHCTKFIKGKLGGMDRERYPALLRYRCPSEAVTQRLGLFAQSFFWKDFLVMELKNTTLDDVAAVIGFSATLRLAAWFGDGGNLYVPEKINADQVLARLIGVSAAQRLCDEWGGEHLALPRLTAYEDDVKRRVVGRMLEQGFSTREVSTHIRMSERRIQQIARELESAGLIEVIVSRKNQKKNQEAKSPNAL